MTNLWRWLRIALLTTVFIILGIYLFTTTPWHRFFKSIPTYADKIAQGRPIVEAVYQFKAATNLWPEYLDDLTPKYLPQKPTADWYYTLTPQGPSLAASTDQSRTHVGFDFDAANPQWRVFGDLDNRSLQSLTNSPTTHPSPPPQEQLVNSELAEFDRRIAREKTVIDHYRDKASVLRSLNRASDAQAVIDLAEQNNPGHFWPPLARAALTLSPDAIQQFSDWTTAHPSFTHFYYLAILHRLHHDDAAALGALESTLTQNPEVGPDDPNILAFYFFDAARYALAQQDIPLVLKLTTAWQKAQHDNKLDENSGLAFSAAAYLAQSDFKSALLDLNTLADRKSPTWAQNLPALRQAIKKKDATFKYDGGPTPPSYEIFAIPN